MADLAENLRTKFLATEVISSKVGSRVHQNRVPAIIEPRPFIYFARTGTEHARALDDSQGQVPFHHSFAVECIGDSPAQANALADAVRTLDDFSGALGDSTAKHLFVDDQDDDYAPVGAGSDQGRFVAALAVEVYI